MNPPSVLPGLPILRIQRNLRAENMDETWPIFGTLFSPIFSSDIDFNWQAFRLSDQVFPSNIYAPAMAANQFRAMAI